MEKPTPIQILARRCAEQGLKIRDARAFFEAAYMADALVQSGGNRTRAAEIAGFKRTSFYKLRRRVESKEDN